MARTTQAATPVPLPTTLAGTTVKVRDSAGVSRDAPLFFVAPAQVGLDQGNVRLPRILAGRGEVDVVLTADNKAANTVRVAIN
ncbi:MAG: hypothetical protein ACREVZ_12205 [Burkholderiales bacterium]